MFNLTDAFAGVELGSTLMAYLDPGSGSMMLQIVVAGLFSSVFFLKSSFGYLKSKLAGLRVSR